jgi:hypothetical protein
VIGQSHHDILFRLRRHNWTSAFTSGSGNPEDHRLTAEVSSQMVQFANKMRRLILKITFLVAIIISTGGWIWLLGLGITWLIVKL